MRERKQGEKLRGRITSSLSCNIIIHLITSVFLPSPSSLLALPNYLLRILFSVYKCIIQIPTIEFLFLCEKEEGGREVVRRMDRNEGEEAVRVMRRIERKEGER
jgi:hypothetical protein